MGLENQGRLAHRPRKRPLSPTEPFGKALGDFIESVADRKRKLTQERIDTVRPDGSVVIRGTLLPVTGQGVPLLAGETVAVAWRDGKMDVVMRNMGRRGAGGATFVPTAAAVAEEFVPSIATDAIFFRDHQNFVPVDYAQAREAAGMNTNRPLLTWGIGSTSFVVMRGTNDDGDLIFGVCRISRPKVDQPFPKVEKVTLTLLRAYNLTTIGHTFGTATAAHSFGAGATIMLPVGYVGSVSTTTNMPAGGVLSIENRVSSPAIAPNGDFIICVDSEVRAISTSFVTDVELHTGTKIVNVTRFTVLENKMTTALTASFLTPLGNVAFTCNTGESPDRSGEVLALLSLNGSKATEAATVGNFVMQGPAFILGLPRPALQLVVVGQLAQTLGALAGGDIAEAETARLQGSRTAVVWAPTGSVTGPRRLLIADLIKRKVSALVGNPNLLFGTAPPAPQPFTNGFPASRALFLGRDGLVYSPRDLVSPFTRQFYWEGHQDSGAFMINLATPKRRSDLAPFAKMAAPKSQEQADGITNGGGDLQVFQPAAS